MWPCDQLLSSSALVDVTGATPVAGQNLPLPVGPGDKGSFMLKITSPHEPGAQRDCRSGGHCHIGALALGSGEKSASLLLGLLDQILGVGAISLSVLGE